MSGGYEAIKVTDNIYWVGAIDWGLRNFHGYETSRGSTYNAFLIMADKVTLIDTVKANMYDEMVCRIRSVIDPAKIDYVVSTHSEMDHSGSIPRFLAEFGQKTVFASPKGVDALTSHFDWATPPTAVENGGSLSLGNRTLQFIETRMLHWPDSMFAFLAEEGVLFSNDAFGMHTASAERFADEVPSYLLEREAAKYYANILLHLSKVVRRFLTKLPTLNLDIKIIAPDHGPIWRTREQINWIVNLYDQWSAQRPTRKAVVVYDTMWSSTEKMAASVADGLAAGGASVELLPLEGAHRSNVLTEVLDAGALLVGSPTMNNQIYPTVADVINYLKGLKPQNLIGASFGSYGWSGEGVKHLDTMLEEMGIDLVEPGFRVKYVPKPDDLDHCRELGLKVAARLCENAVG